jgi:mRNA interferase ChpB
MVRRIRFDRGDIVSVSLEPTLGRELKGDMRPVLVLSSREFNEYGTALVVPITQGGDFARHAGFAVPFDGDGLKTRGVALANQIRMLDLESRGARKIEKVPDFLVEDALARIQAILA